MAGLPTLITRSFQVFVVLALVPALLVAGCSLNATRSSGANDSPQAVSRKAAQRPEKHRVKSGDTLYAIAFHYGLDYRELAAWNGIGPPYVIRSGDSLRLRPAYGRWAANRPPPAPDGNDQTVAVEPAQGRPAVDDSAGAARTIAIVDPPAGSPPVPVTVDPVRSGTRPTIAAATKPPAARKPVASKPQARPSAIASSVSGTGTVIWKWPAQGQVTGEFSMASPLQRGLDIAGNVGQEVNAAAAGEVVYSGNGLVGYGELIIVKHNDRFLSAYGHNRRRFVKEGDSVAAGQKIAELGDTGTNRAKLHFEIRENGQPVDPRIYLPKR